jgi:hypothetical protein
MHELASWRRHAAVLALAVVVICALAAERHYRVRISLSEGFSFEPAAEGGHRNK